MLKKSKTIFACLLFSFIGTTHAATSDFIVENTTYAAKDNSEYAHVIWAVPQFIHGDFTVPQNSTTVVTLPAQTAPMYFEAKIYFNNTPLATTQNCTHGTDQTKPLKLRIMADKNPIDANSVIKCEWSEG